MSRNVSMGEEKTRGLRLKLLRWFLQFAVWVLEGNKKGICIKNCHWGSIKGASKRIKRGRDQQKRLHLPGCSFTLFKMVQLQQASKDMLAFLLPAICATSHAIL